MYFGVFAMRVFKQILVGGALVAAMPAAASVYAVDGNGLPSTSAANAASITTGPSGAVLTAHASGGGQAQALLVYSFHLGVGSSGNISPGQLLTVPLTISFASYAQIGGGNDFRQAYTSLDVSSFDGTNFDFTQDCEGDFGVCGATGPMTSNFDYHYAFLSNAGQLTTAPDIQVTMQAYASGSLADAWIDPVITINTNAPGGAQFADWTISGGAVTPATTVGGVPEPESWALLLVGLGGIGAVQRRARRGFAAA